MNRILFITICLFLQIVFLQAQEKSNNSGKIGLFISSFGENDVFRFNELDGAAHYEGEGFYTFGVNYLLELNNWLEFETGLAWSIHQMRILPAYYPGAETASRKEDFSIISLPFTLRATFLRYIFINGGPFIGIDASMDSSVESQTGFGLLAGVGLKYDFEFGLGLFVNPYAKVYSLLPFTDIENHQRVSENGFRFGVIYNLRR